MPSAANILQQLMDVIVDRRARMPADSYTTKLFQGGTAKIGEKITEEAGEVVEAGLEVDACLPSSPRPTTGAERPSPEMVPPPAEHVAHDHLVHEAADLIYHLFVMLAYHQVTLHEVEAKLAGRFGISGLAEKASRPAMPASAANAEKRT